MFGSDSPGSPPAWVQGQRVSGGDRESQWVQVAGSSGERARPARRGSPGLVAAPHGPRLAEQGTGTVRVLGGAQLGDSGA